MRDQSGGLGCLSRVMSLRSAVAGLRLRPGGLGTGPSARHAGGLLQTEGTEARLPRRGDVIRTGAAALTLVRGIEA